MMDNLSIRVRDDLSRQEELGQPEQERRVRNNLSRQEWLKTI
jgi:hypothetical protein